MITNLDLPPAVTVVALLVGPGSVLNLARAVALVAGYDNFDPAHGVLRHRPGEGCSLGAGALFTPEPLQAQQVC